ncbi:PIG-L deacetylase family protein [Vibrio sp. 99-8-1]|uniref:PIG-L deacetylase family protein n=1 Tax=Vibrio sp. 99-8-1 TaxID=2607602 RepID=UPI0014933D17|nr:PIG-L deacetylase family protein [Vibrio sp. 99-8-1]NOI65715.1 PIG-L family deacetylase [Vibrio sp. 99-8-1]
MNSKIALAIMAHPDDIEWRASGTLMQLKNAGWEIHYVSLANGCYGTREHSYQDIVAIRRKESMEAAKFMGAIYHESICDDLSIYHSEEMVKKVAAIIRTVQPDIILTHPLEDYMEDHMNTARLTCTAAFARAAVNYQSLPEVSAYNKDVCIYMSQPHRLHNRMRQPIGAELYIDVTSYMEVKSIAICLHKSQEAWLGESQSTKTLADEMIEDCREMGNQSKKYAFAEGWSRFYHVGYCDSEYDPLYLSLHQHAIRSNN